MSHNMQSIDGTPLTSTQLALYMRLEVERELSGFDYSVHPHEEWPRDFMDEPLEDLNGKTQGITG